MEPTQGSARWFSLPCSKSELFAFAAIAILVIAAGIPRLVALDRVPLGLNQDEACNGYDAYSLLKTGRDQHGNRLPIVIQAFNDYRMALFDYSLVPVVAVFGLEPSSVRLGAAFWGITDLIALAILGWLMLGARGSAVAVILAALSPWHLQFSRFGHEAIASAATISWATACFLLWERRRWSGWLILSALFFGLSIYSYSITKLFVPVWILVLAMFYWRDLRRSIVGGLIAAGIIVLCAAPQMVLLMREGAKLQARFDQVSVFRASGWSLTTVGTVVAGVISHFEPGFLFIRGQQGRYAEMFHAPGFGQLLAAQAAMVVLGLFALYDARYRKSVILLLSWLVVAALPPAMTLPVPHSLRDVLAITPWTLLSALGLIFLLDLAACPALARRIAAGGLMLAALWQGGIFLRFYFGPYASLAARSYQYGMEQVVRATEQLSHDDSEPVIITQRMNQPYIYVLFYRRYPPELFQNLVPRDNPVLFAKVRGFDRYRFQDPSRWFARLDQGIFVFSGDEQPPAPAAVTIRYPDGEIAYQVLTK